MMTMETTWKVSTFRTAENTGPKIKEALNICVSLEKVRFTRWRGSSCNRLRHTGGDYLTKPIGHFSALLCPFESKLKTKGPQVVCSSANEESLSLELLV